MELWHLLFGRIRSITQNLVASFQNECYSKERYGWVEKKKNQSSTASAHSDVIFIHPDFDANSDILQEKLFCTYRTNDVLYFLYFFFQASIMVKFVLKFQRFIFNSLEVHIGQRQRNVKKCLFWFVSNWWIKFSDDFLSS
jgi:hypothetical protein